MKIFRSILTVGSLTGLSRLLGLLRDTLMTAFMGAGVMSDLFWIAFRLPNFFRRLLAEGAMSAAFIPLFSDLKTKGYSVAIHHIRGIHTVLILILLCLVVFMELFTPSVVVLTAPGLYEKQEQLHRVVELARIMFPYILFISLTALYSSILNTEGKFSAAALSPSILNVAMIVALFTAKFLHLSYAFSLAYGMIIAGMLQGFFVLKALKKRGPLPGLTWPCFDSFAMTWLKRMIPGLIGASAMQINTVIDMAMASFLPPGSISYLFFADRLNQLPLGLLGIGMSTVLLPHLSQSISESKFEQAKHLQNRILEYTLLFSVPAALALMILGPSIICVLYERGAFDRQAVLNTGYALSALALGLPAYILIKIFSTVFFAHKDTKTPVKIGLMAIGVNICLNIGFFFYFKHIGIALATSIAAWFNAGYLAYILYKKNHMPTQYLKERFINMIMANGCLGICLGLGHYFFDVLTMPLFIDRFFYLMGFIGLGGGAYILFLITFNAINIKEIKNYLAPTQKDI